MSIDQIVELMNSKIYEYFRDTCVTVENVNNDRSINKNFWAYIKRALVSKNSPLPSFSLSKCIEYLSQTLSALAPKKCFIVPAWIPLLEKLTITFSKQPPSYQAVTSIVPLMKASTTPNPLDKTSIICFKRYPYLRSFLTEIIRKVWVSGVVALGWKKAAQY